VDREQEESRDRAIRLFEYLKRLAELRTRTVRDLDEYTEVVWFAEVPSEPECRVATGVRPADPARWLTLERPRRVRPPELPEVLAPWLDRRELEDSDGEPAPHPEAELVAVYRGADGEVERLERRALTDHPEVPVAWHRYRGRWERWAAEDRRQAPVYQLYKRLFDVEQLGNQLGEQFETVLGVGLLTWAGPSGVARKHLLTMPAELRFDAETGRIAVGPPEDGARLTLEEDMLEARSCRVARSSGSWTSAWPRPTRGTASPSTPCCGHGSTRPTPGARSTLRSCHRPVPTRARRSASRRR
jgi:hypothetical protein